MLRIRITQQPQLDIAKLTLPLIILGQQQIAGPSGILATKDRVDELL